MDIISILKILKSKLWVLIAFPMVSVVIAILLVMQIDKVYKSSAQLATGFTSDESVNLSEDKTSNQFEVNTRFINTVESMKSIPVLSLVSYRLMLYDLENEVPFRELKDSDDLGFTLDSETRIKLITFFKAHLDSILVLNTYNQENQMASSVLKAYGYDYESLSEEMSIYRKSLSDFIVVDFKSENPKLSAFTVNALCEEFIRFNKVLKTDRSSESIDFLQKLVEERRKARDNKVAELNSYKVNNDIYNYSAESSGKISQIASYEASKEIEQKNIAALTLSLNSVQLKLGESNVVDQKEIAKVNQRIIELRRRISDLGMNQDEASKTKASQLRDELQLEISRLDNLNNVSDQTDLDLLTKEKERLQLELQIARGNLATIDGSLTRLKSTITGFAAKEARLAELERDLEVISTEYQSAQEKYNSAVNKASVIGSSLRQIIMGLPSDEPESSKKITLVLIAGVGSFVLCAIIILLMDVTNLTIRTQSRLERVTGIKNIATLNQNNLSLMKVAEIFQTKTGNKEDEAFVHFLRKFRFEVQSSSKQLILVTSTKPLVGKSFIIINLAYSLSLLNKRVLIIDTNFKSSTLTRLLIPNANVAGLLKRENQDIKLLKSDNEYYQEKIQGDNGNNFIHGTPYKSVDIIGNMGGKDSPSEILAGRDFRKMLDNLLVEYDYILMEGASLNDYSDTRELVEYVDSVIPVFDASSTLNNLDHDSIKYLRTIKSKILGTVLNNVSLSDLSI
jgi:polysaccharide biosynthesis transport protein